MWTSTSNLDIIPDVIYVGVMLVCPSPFSLVVVEGCPKSMKRYHKLMLRRIDWNAKPLDAEGDGLEDEGDEDNEQQSKTINTCHLVWQVWTMGGDTIHIWAVVDKTTPA